MSELGGKMARGAAWMVLFKFVERGLGLISTIVLARLLMPKDFGLIAMAMSFVAVLELLGTFGFDMALIQRPHPERRHYDTAWTFNVLFRLSCSALMVAGAGVVAGFYNEPRLISVLFCLALGSVAEGFQNVGVVAFRKDMEFNKEFVFLATRRVVAFVVTITLAVTFRNYWALVAGMLTARFVGLAMSYVMHPYRPWFSLAGFHDLFHFSKWLLTNNVLLFFKNRSADFIIGRIAGAGALGYYSVADQVANLPVTELVSPISRALYPGYAKLAANLTDLRRGFVSVMSLLALISIPMGVGIMATADPFVRLVMGPKWIDVIPLIQVLALVGALNAIVANNGSVYLAIGKPRIPTILMSCSVVVLIPMLIWSTARAGALGAAYTLMGVAVLLLPIEFTILVRVLHLRVSQVASVLWRPLAGAIVMYVSVSWLLRQIPASPDVPGQFVRLGSAVATGLVVYLAMISSLWLLASRPDSGERIVLGFIKSKLHRQDSTQSGSEPEE